MTSDSVFVGLVTHPRSRFNSAGVGIATAIAEGFAAAGVQADLLVSDRNDYDAAQSPLSRSVLAVSAIHQADLEYRWRRYLAAAGASEARGVLRDRLVRVGMAAKRLTAREAAVSAVRLLNIDLSHLRVMEAATASGAGWSLVLEDDAASQDPAASARELAQLTSALEPTDVQFVSVSASLSAAELGVLGILSPAHDIVSDGTQLFRASRPVTNTVCATLYRTSYLDLVRASILHRELIPIAPIDWRVNEVIMDLYEQGVLDSGSCMWTEPGIFVQRSMHG